MIWMVLIEWVAKLIAGVGAVLAVLVAAFNYRHQTRIKQAEWLKSLFEKFFESPIYKDVRVWLDYDMLHDQLNVADAQLRRTNEEKFTDFLNFFEFIGVLYSGNQLTFGQVFDVFDYYLKKIKSDPDCENWIARYSFEKLKALLEKVDNG